MHNKHILHTTLLAGLVAGLVAGVLDILAAILVNWLRFSLPPGRVLQSVASGLLGGEAYTGGAATAIAGLLLHFAMMFVIAAIFVIAAQRLMLLRRQPLLAGVAYGVVVYAVMNFIVLPLSAFPHMVRYDLVALVIQIACVGLPIALLTSSRRTA